MKVFVSSANCNFSEKEYDTKIKFLTTGRRHIMEIVIKKLTEIEVAAKQIMKNANAELKVLDANMQAQTEAFDAEVEETTRTRLEDLREKLQKENSEALQKLQSDTEQTLHYLQHCFEQNHSVLADKIVQRIIEV